MRLSSSIAVLVAALTRVRAQYLVNDLSFGYGVRINPEGKPEVPGFSLQGAPVSPEVLSNKVILTPPAPGNYRGAVWSDRPLDHADWIADVEFRATGPERGGGNLQIWLVRDGASRLGSSSIYTAGRFEGLALVIDGHGHGGMVRGFLNDGQTEYKPTNADQFSFGHCGFPYRNLGRPSQVKLRHSASGLRVEVDGNLCFESDQVRLPTGYHLGITAASAENPDSFEVFKLVVLTEDKATQHQDRTDGGSPPPPVPDTPLGGAKSSGNDARPDQNADQITGTQAQFADLHNRLQDVNHQFNGLFKAFSAHGQANEQRHAETAVFLGELKGRLTMLDKLDRLEQLDQRLGGLEQRIGGLERELQKTRNDLGRNVRDAENAVKSFVSERQSHMQEDIKIHVTPGHTKLIIVIVLTQLLLVAAYVIYKRRKSSPKKYL